MKRSSIIGIVALVVIAGAAYALLHKSSTSTSTTTPTSSQSTSSTSSTNATGSVDIRDMAFSPSQITVAKGATVTWTNNDSVTHTVVDDLADVGGPASGNISPGSTYSFTFNKTGSFQYHCSIHSSMRGTIVVK